MAVTSSTLASIAIPSSYGWVLLTAIIICAHYSLHVMPISAARKKYFTKQFFQENFPGVNAAKGGYPDMGSGLYASKLDTASWIALNNAQRVHYNYLENLATVLTSVLISGINYPRYTVLLGGVFLFGRTLYTLGYLSGGAKKRSPGAIIGGSAVPMLLLGALSSAWNLSGGVTGLMKLLQG